MKVTVLLYWSWDGDGWLNQSFVGVKSSIEEAKLLFNEARKHSEKLYLPGEETPQQDDGTYKSKGFYQIIERVI